jgi:hypothetical protein
MPTVAQGFDVNRKAEVRFKPVFIIMQRWKLQIKVWY